MRFWNVGTQEMKVQKNSLKTQLWSFVLGGLSNYGILTLFLLGFIIIMTLLVLLAIVNELARFPSVGALGFMARLSLEICVC